MNNFKREQFLPVDIRSAWDFISDPRNLERITPSGLDFRLISDVPERMHNGLIIEYRVRPLLGIPVRWVSLIKDIQEPFCFTDEQLKGPYAHWSHTHILREVAGGVVMEDIIRYAPPFDGLLPFLDSMIVLPRLKSIFDFRTKTLDQLFPPRAIGKQP